MSEDLYPIAVLIDELKSEDTNRRVHSVKSLSTIAVALGHERTRLELIPYLSELLDDEEEVLIELATSLSALFDLVGGRHYAHTLFDPLEQLCQIEDAPVRAAAVTSYKDILDRLDGDVIEPAIVDSVNRLAKSDWYAAQVGAAQLIPFAAKGLSENGQGVLLERLKEMLQSEHPLVRKAVGESLKGLIGTVSPRFDGRLVDMLGILSVDKEDSVKMLTVENLLVFSRMRPNKVHTTLLPLFRILVEDSSWRIRYLITNHITEFAASFGEEHKNGLLRPYYLRFLQDPEPEVRTVACAKLAEFCALLSPSDVAGDVLPLLPSLAKEPDYIKATLATQLSRLCKQVGKPETNRHLMGVFLELLRGDNAEIKVCLLTDLDGIAEVIGAESLVQSIMPAVREFIEHKNWRIRSEIVEVLSVLGKQLGAEYFGSNLTEFYFAMLSDPVYSIREKAVKNLRKLVEAFGKEWVEARVLDELIEGNPERTHIQKMTLLMVLRELVPALSEQYINYKLLRIFTVLAEDSVANVRLGAAKTIKEAAAYVTEDSVRMKLKGLLAKLREDEDPDVKHFAAEAGY